MHATPLFPLPDLALVSVRGPDAARFTQSQWANDVEALAVGCWQWNCCLNAQGRALALMLVLRPSSDELWAVLPAALQDAFVVRSKKYVLRSKAVVQSETQMAICGRMQASSSDVDVETQGELSDEGGAVICNIGGRYRRELRFGKPLAADDASGLAWALADIEDRIPWLQPEVGERFIPQALSLERLQAFSVKKGCYPGQEIVARMHFLGKNKRGLMRFALPTGTAPPRPGGFLYLPDALEGEPQAEIVACALDHESKPQGLCVAKLPCPSALAYKNGATALVAAMS